MTTRYILPLLLLAIAALAGAQETTTPPIFTDRIEVNLVEILVRVTDQDGNPVRGMTREDFQVFEDGDSVEITNFMAVEDREVVVGGLGAPTPPSEADDGAPAAPLPEAEPAGPLYLSIFIDNTSLQQRNRKKALKGLQEFLDSELQPGDHVMVAVLGETYEIALPFTTDPQEVIGALEAAKKQGGTEGDAREAGLRNLLRDIQGQIITLETAEAHAMRTRFTIDQMARRAQMRIRRATGALQYLMSSQAGLPGQHALLYVGEGLPMRPGEGPLHAYYNKYGNAADIDSPEILAADYELSRDMDALSRHAQATGVTFYAIDAAGQRTGPAMSAEMDMGERDSALLSGLQLAWTQREEEIHIRNQQETIRLVAGDTGGEVMLNNRNYARFLDEMRQDLDNFYSLGFQAPHPKQGDFHNIRVEVEGKGLKAHFQRGYQDKTWSQRLTDAVVSELLLGVGENPLDVAISTGDPEIDGDKAELEISVLVPLDRLTLIPHGDEMAGSVSAVLLVRDPLGNTSAPHLIPMTVRLPEGWEESEGPTQAEARIPLRVDRGSGMVGVGVRDELSEAISTTTLPFDID